MLYFWNSKNYHIIIPCSWHLCFAGKYKQIFQAKGNKKYHNSYSTEVDWYLLVSCYFNIIYMKLFKEDWNCMIEIRGGIFKKCMENACMKKIMHAFKILGPSLIYLSFYFHKTFWKMIVCCKLFFFHLFHSFILPFCSVALSLSLSQSYLYVYNKRQANVKSRKTWSLNWWK